LSEGAIDIKIKPDVMNLTCYYPVADGIQRRRVNVL